MALRAIIAGAGPTGLTAAVELARRGAKVQVFEARPGPSGLSRAVGLQPRSIDLLRPCGAADGIEKEAVHVSEVILHEGAREAARMRAGFDHDSSILSLPQDRTEAHLREALKRYGPDVQYDTRILDFVDDGEKVVVETNKGTFEADYLIGADGTHSTVREKLGIEFEGYDLPDKWSIADIDVEGWTDPSAFKLFLLDDGQIEVVVPLSKGRWRVVATTEDALASLPVKLNIVKVRNASTFRISVRQVPQYSMGRVYLAGDAAHCHSPVGGRGMNLGIADSVELAKRLMEGTTEGYTASRHAEGKKVLRLSERGRTTFQTDSTLRRKAAVWFLQFSSAVPPVGRALVRRLISG